MYSTILWATDGSPEADAALREAVDLLEPHGKLIAFHCDQRFTGVRVAGMAVLPDESDRREHIDAQVRELRGRGVDVAEIVDTSTNEPAREIAFVAHEQGADAIVCGTRGLHGLAALLNGSVAARVLKRTSVPVVVVPSTVAAN